MRGESEVECIALIDLVDRHRRALEHLAGHHFVGARSGKYQTKRDGRFFHAKARDVQEAMRKIVGIKKELDPPSYIIDQGSASFMPSHA